MNKLFAFVLSFALIAGFAGATWPAGSHANTASVFGEAIKSVAPQIMAIQGIAVNGTTDAPLSGLYSITFSIYNHPTAGSLVWSETLSVNVNEGYFDALMGSGGTTNGVNCFDSNSATADLFTSIICAQKNSADGNAYLQVTIGSDALLPRYKLGVAPYSFAADYAAVTFEQVTALGNWTNHPLNISADYFLGNVLLVNNTNSMLGVGVYGMGALAGVQGKGDAALGSGVVGSGHIGVGGTGGAYGLYGTGFTAVRGDGSTAGTGGLGQGIGVYGQGYYGVKAIGLDNNTASIGAYAEGYTGVYGNASNETGTGVQGYGDLFSSGALFEDVDTRPVNNYTPPYGLGVYGHGFVGVEGYGNLSDGVGVAAVGATGLFAYGLIGVNATGGAAGVYGQGTFAGVYGDAAIVGVYGKGNTSQSSSIGVQGLGQIGVWGSGTVDNGGYFETDTNSVYALEAHAATASGNGLYVYGNASINGKLSADSGIYSYANCNWGSAGVSSTLGGLTTCNPGYFAVAGGCEITTPGVYVKSSRPYNFGDGWNCSFSGEASGYIWVNCCTK